MFEVQIAMASNQNESYRKIITASDFHAYRTPGIYAPYTIKIKKPTKMKGRKWKRLSPFFKSIVRCCNQNSNITLLQLPYSPYEKAIEIELANADDWNTIIPLIKELVETDFKDEIFRIEEVFIRVYSGKLTPGGGAYVDTDEW